MSRFGVCPKKEDTLLNKTLPIALAGLLLSVSAAVAQDDTSLSLDTVNTARLGTLLAQDDGAADERAEAEGPRPVIVRLQVLLDRAGASPGVIDGYDGENVRKAIAGLETLNGLNAGGELDDEVVGLLETDNPVLMGYTVTQDDADRIVDPLPDDYAELAKRDFLGFTSVAEELAERFHMDIDLLKALNPDTRFAVGEEIVVANPGDAREGKVARIEADKKAGQVRAYDESDRLIVAYPATVGSRDNPSPQGTHTVEAIAPEPNYTYRPDENFKQGDNDEPLVLAPGPNNPVGSVWIDLSEPTFGIHGTPEPEHIGKTASHGCVRLTNWDAEELAAMVENGVTVDFVQ
ncbi:murein L,D-transpeptidase [Devosia sp. PTR5]|uniref:Murein L,D-transpeptidase n=1 Tax=Devosia oryzisoli TaxID=2774138 RepID=A0A927FTL9_9HYPH|nr:murein L,D-transpeptidase [Devosia oryzisoli]